MSHVHNGLLVCHTTIIDNQFIVISQCVAHGHLQLTGESFFIVCKGVAQYEFSFVYLFGIPNSCMSSCRSSVKVIGTVVDSQTVFFSVHCEFTLANTVAIATNKGREEWFGTCYYVLDIVVSLNNVGNFTIAVRYHYRHKSTTIVGDVYFHSIIVHESVQVSLFSLYNGLKIFTLQTRDVLWCHGCFV